MAAARHPPRRSPGIGSIQLHNTEVTRRYLPEADAVIFVASVDQPISRNELVFLGEIRAESAKVFCLLNMIDHLTEPEVAESVAFASAVLLPLLHVPTAVFPVSARLALEGRLADDPVLLARSGLPAFDAALRQFLSQERDAVWQRSVRQRLGRLLDEARRSIELELRALTSPLAVLDANLAAFAAKKASSLQARCDLDALLDADSRRLVKQRIEPNLETFKTELLPTLAGLLDGWYLEIRSPGSAALQSGLEGRLIEEGAWPL